MALCPLYNGSSARCPVLTLYCFNCKARNIASYLGYIIHLIHPRSRIFGNKILLYEPYLYIFERKIYTYIIKYFLSYCKNFLIFANTVWGNLTNILPLLVLVHSSNKEESSNVSTERPPLYRTLQSYARNFYSHKYPMIERLSYMNYKVNYYQDFLEAF